MFKNLTNLASMMKQAQQMGERMKTIGEELKSRRVTGTSGGGLIVAEMNGAGELLKIHIDPAIIDRGDREMIEDLIPAAVNQAAEKARQMHAEAMQEMTAGLDLPGVQDAISNLVDDDPS